MVEIWAAFYPRESRRNSLAIALANWDVRFLIFEGLVGSVKATRKVSFRSLLASAGFSDVTGLIGGKTTSKDTSETARRAGANPMSIFRHCLAERGVTPYLGSLIGRRFAAAESDCPAIRNPPRKSSNLRAGKGGAPPAIAQHEASRNIGVIRRRSRLKRRTTRVCGSSASGPACAETCVQCAPGPIFFRPSKSTRIGLAFIDGAKKTGGVVHARNCRRPLPLHWRGSSAWRARAEGRLTFLSKRRRSACW